MKRITTTIISRMTYDDDTNGTNKTDIIDWFGVWSSIARQIRYVINSTDGIDDATSSPLAGANDLTSAGAGNHVVYAGQRNDLIDGGSNDDILYGDHIVTAHDANSVPTIRKEANGPGIDIINATVEALNVGGTLTDSFSYQVSDGQGGFDTETLIVTIHGIDDVPVAVADAGSATETVTIHGTDDAPVAVADAGSATEAGITAGSNATGNVLTNDSDVDTPHAALVVSAVAGVVGNVGMAVAGSYGSVTLNADGSYSYVIDNTNATVEALNVGGTLTDSFSYQVSDGQGGVASATLTVTIHGTDDAPVAVADAGSATEAGITAGSNATGNVLTNDSDVDTPHAALVVSAVAGVVGNVGMAVAGSYGSVTLNADGSYSYVIDNTNATVEALNVGGTLTDSFSYQVSDGQGGVASATLTVTIHGTDDYVPAISGLVITETAISFVANDLDNATLSLVSPFASAFGDPVITSGSTTNLTPTEQGSVVSGTLQVTDDSATANVVGLYLGTSAGNSFSAPSTPAAEYGFGGDDTLTGGTGADNIFGGSGNDTIVGGGGADTLFGDAGNDIITYETGATIHGDAASAAAGTDSDTLVLSQAVNINLSVANQDTSTASIVTGFENVDASTVSSAVILTGSSAANTLKGGFGADAITGGAGADTLSGASGNDTFNLTNGDFAAGELIDGSGGTGDAIVLTNATSVDFTTGTVTGIETLIGSSGSDTVTLSSAQWAALSTIDLGGGTNVLNVVASGDIHSLTIPTIGNIATGNLVGTSGDDTVTLTGAQLDAIIIGTGTINLGGGIDTINLTSTSADFNSLGMTDASIQGVEAISAVAAASGVTITVSNQTEGFTITGSANADTITGGSGADSINTAGGNDIINGAQNDILLDGGTGTDTLQVGTNFSSSSNGQIVNIENVTLTASGLTLNLSNQTETFNINGSSGVDIITGGGGNDTINGQAGNDTLTGGGGADQFRLQTNGGTDTISDYTDNTDKIGFRGGNVTGGVSFTNTTPTAAGATVNSSDLATRSTINNINNNDDNHVDVITGSQTSLQITTGTGGSATNTYVIVFNSTTSKGEIWFDTNWNDTANRVQVATLNNVTTLAGVTAITNTDIVVYDSTLGPAGVAGNPITLGLSDPSVDRVGPVTVTIAGITSGWSLSEGADNGDGTWTVESNDIASLTVTSPGKFTGALVLDVAETWTNADGSIGSAFVAGNVEVYAKSGPIFAWSADDHLTGSSGDDLFVFSRPIGNDIIYSFDAAHDKIDLIGYSRFTSFADVQVHMANDAAGNAVITLGDGQTITLSGVDASSLNESDFVFNQTPVTNNTGDMVVGDGAILPLSGIVNNTGTIVLDSASNRTGLELIQYGITLQGGGQLTLSDSDANAVFGTDPSVTFINVDNTISGAGQFGEGQMMLVNECAGTIEATGSNALVIDTGANAVVNSGTLESTGSGGLTINSDVSNSGLLWANGGNLTINGNIGGSGSVLIDGTATMEIGGSFNEDIRFNNTAAGTLKLDHSADFNGVVFGFDGNDILDFADIAMGSATLSYAANAQDTGGTLTVTDGTQTANINLVGQYEATSFQATADNGMGTLIEYVYTGVTPTV